MFLNKSDRTVSHLKIIVIILLKDYNTELLEGKVQEEKKKRELEKAKGILTSKKLYHGK